MGEGDEPVGIGTPDLSDADTLADLWVDLARDQRAYRSHLEPEANRSAVREAITHHIVTDGIRVARTDSVVGFVMFDIEHGEYEQDAVRGIVHNLFVRPDCRFRGIGARLLETAESVLAEAGAEVVALEAMADNEDARRFYARQGYRPHRIELEKRVGNDTHSKEDG